MNNLIRAAHIENGKVVNIWMVPFLDCYPDKTLVEAGICNIGWEYKDGEFIAPDTMPESIGMQTTPGTVVEAQLKNAVQIHLDSVARSHGYESILSACSYALCDNEFQGESKAFFLWRSACWSHCFKVIDLSEADGVQLPLVADFVATLPTFNPAPENAA
jgi:hypothetical protein